jgi:hypothetical protein
MQRNKQALTNEKLKELFTSNFDLANYAIEMGKQMVQAGQEVNPDHILDDIFKYQKDAELK